jgi:CHAD domain-containing protein
MVEQMLTCAEPANAPDPQRLQALALGLFDRLVDDHSLPAATRRLLQLVGAYYVAALRAGAIDPARAARDAVLAAPIEGLSAEKQCIVASAVMFQREQPDRRCEPAFLRLNRHDQLIAVRLAALLALAVIHSIELPGDLLVGRADGRLTSLVDTALAGELRTRLLDRWRQRWGDAIGTLVIRPNVPGNSMSHTAALCADIAATKGFADSGLLLARPLRLSGEEPLAEGARQGLRQLFERMLTREVAVRSNDDPEDVHQMRVTTRRLRACLEVVAPIYDVKIVRHFRTGLRRPAAALGIVRDRDVLLEHIQAYRARHSPQDSTLLEPLVMAVEHDRAEAHRVLLTDLDADQYAAFKHNFANFLTTSGAGVPERLVTGAPTRVRDLAGSLIWRRYEEWRAFEVVVTDGGAAPLHQARIAGKRLRYIIEFFAEALGPQTEDLLAPLVALQDTLGSLQDSVVARTYVHDLGLDNDLGARAYLGARAAEQAALLAELPIHWARVSSPAYRGLLLELIGQL